MRALDARELKQVEAELAERRTAGHAILCDKGATKQSSKERVDHLLKCTMCINFVCQGLSFWWGVPVQMFIHWTLRSILLFIARSLS